MTANAAMPAFAIEPDASDAPSPLGARAPLETAGAAAERAAGRVPPLWPLTSFVAVNPFLGLADRRFEDAAGLLAWVGQARLAMPRAFYAEAIAAGRITDGDLAAALEAAKGRRVPPGEVAALKAAARAQPGEPVRSLATVADLATRLTGRDWAEVAAERVSTWAAAHFDRGQALWRFPWRSLSPYRSWRSYAALDRTPEIAGLPKFRSSVAGLPADAAGAIGAAVAALGVPERSLEPYFHRLLLSISGWAGHARYLDWQAGLGGTAGNAVLEMLAVRLGWEVGLLKAFDGSGTELAAAWERACVEMAAEAPGDPDRDTDMLLQAAYEASWRRGFLARLPQAAAATRVGTTVDRPLVQAAFCIDVRSEVFRRALEGLDAGIETLGFAGFFGFPIEHVRAGDSHGTARCPVLLRPSVVVEECPHAPGAAADGGRARLASAFRQFRSGPVGPFGFVETLGLGYLGRLAAEGFGWRSPARSARLRSGARSPAPVRLVGTGEEARVDLAAGALRGMSLTGGFARLVVLIGHGATSANNPYASGLDCGACGGHDGEINARIAAATLNDPAVRRGLAERGIVIPEDTVFLAGLHDTTTDRVALFDGASVPASHAADLERLNAWLSTAGALVRAERAGTLNMAPDEGLSDRVVARASDWSQVRPEWGLAGCAAFVAAPRARTAGVDLGGRVFLHSYEWRRDADFKVLELILTAPLVVASWINLQYYASTVDNRRFGSGNKTLHNVAGLLGVIEGNAGDLRTGLPWQSVHDGLRLVHEPLRLSAVVEAPTEAIDAVLGRHDHVRHLVENGWIHLFALTEAGTMRRHRDRAAWTAVASGDARAEAA